MTSPFDSTNSPYPLLTAWYYGRLEKEWKAVKQNIIEADHTLSQERAGEIAAANLSFTLGREYLALENEVKRRTDTYMDTGEGMDTLGEELIDFYDKLGTLIVEGPYYKRILVDLSQTRTLISDEQALREKEGK